MPRDRDRPGWSELRPGLLLLGGLAVVAGSIFFLDVVLRELAEGPELIVTAAEARDLEVGAAVWVAGVPGGRVTAIRFLPPGGKASRRVVLRTSLRSDVAETMRRDASAVIRASALLAPAVVDVRPGRAEAPYDFSDTLRAANQIDREELQARADSVFERLATLQPLADRLRTRLTEGPGTFAAFARDDALRASLARSLERLDALAARASEGSAARLAADTGLHRALDRVRDRGAALADDGPGSPGWMEGDLRAEMEELRQGLGWLTGRVTGTRGTAGRLRTDPALDREARLLRARLDSVRTELLSRPFRWLRFRLF